jgi:hypothetical protein
MINTTARDEAAINAVIGKRVAVKGLAQENRHGQVIKRGDGHCVLVQWDNPDQSGDHSWHSAHNLRLV